MQPISNWYDYHQHREQKALEQAQNKASESKIRRATNIITRITQILGQSVNHEADVTPDTSLTRRTIGSQ